MSLKYWSRTGRIKPLALISLVILSLLILISAIRFLPISFNQQKQHNRESDNNITPAKIISESNDKDSKQDKKDLALSANDLSICQPNQELSNGQLSLKLQCWIKTQEFTNWAKPENIRVIDLRSIVKYQDRRIANSLNLKAFEVKTLSHLKNESVLLISEPFKKRELETLCVELTKLGFTDLKLLAGGFNALADEIEAQEQNKQDQLKTEFKIDGPKRDTLDALDITVLDLFHEVGYQNWNILILAEQIHRNKAVLIPNETLTKLAKVQVLNSLNELLDTLIKLNSDPLQSSPTAIVLDGSYIERQKLSSTIKQAKIADTYVLDSDLTGLNQYIANNTTALKQIEQEALKLRCG